MSSDISLSATVPFEKVLEIERSETSGVRAERLSIGGAKAADGAIDGATFSWSQNYLNKQARAVSGSRPPISIRNYFISSLPRPLQTYSVV
jgi:hypothetical protein